MVCTHGLGAIVPVLADQEDDHRNHALQENIVQTIDKRHIGGYYMNKKVKYSYNQEGVCRRYIQKRNGWKSGSSSWKPEQDLSGSTE